MGPFAALAPGGRGTFLPPSRVIITADVAIASCQEDIDKFPPVLATFVDRILIV
jgi:hypothetical protein